MVLLRRCVVLFAALHAGLCLAALTFEPTPDVPNALPELAADATPGIHIAPYVQALGPDTVTLMLEMHTAVPVTLVVTDPAGAEHRFEDRAARLHEITVTGLEPERTYRYEVRGADGQVLGGSSFTTWPVDPETVQFFAYGDTRTRADEHRKVAEAMAARADGRLFVLHSGDIVADGRRYEQWPSQFFDPARALLARLPLMVVAGNHEQRSELFRNYFRLPDTEWYYGFRAGPVHVITIDTYKHLDLNGDWQNSEQWKWLQEEVRRAEAAPWRIAMLHTPLYSRGPHGALDEQGNAKEAPMRWAREHLEPLLREHGFQLTFHGHDHVYERSHRDGLTMITTGGGGAPNYKASPPEQNPYSQVLVSAIHFCDITATPTTLTLEAIDGEGKTIDRFTLERGEDGKTTLREATAATAN